MALEEFLGISNDKLLTSFAETLYMVGIALIIVTIVALQERAGYTRMW